MFFRKEFVFFPKNLADFSTQNETSMLGKEKTQDNWTSFELRYSKLLISSIL